MSLVDLLCSVTTGAERRRCVLTPVMLAIAISLLLLLVVGSLSTDRVLGLPALVPGVLGTSTGIVVLAAGVALWGWCMVLFKGKGVPLNPPRDVVAVGPYGWVRNPMLLGFIAAVVGLGFVIHSVSLVVIWTPVFVILNVIELTLVEEPELERRLGAGYSEYRKRVPMFIPRRPPSPRRECRPGSR